jgi:DNA-directed RNA polymerase specialized sigma24 family protein
MKRLEEEYRGPLKMWMQGWPHDQIAKQFQINEGNSHKRVYRGKLNVKECMGRKGWTE